MNRHVAIIGAGAVGSASAIEALRQGNTVTIIEPGSPGAKQASSYGNASWLSSHSVVMPAEPGVWKKVPGYLMDPLGPLCIRPTYLMRASPWLFRYLVAGSTYERIAKVARALRPLLVDGPKLHAKLAAEAGVPQLIAADSGLMHIYQSRAVFEADAQAWKVRSDVGVRWEELEEDELKRRQPNLHPRYKFGVFVGEAGHCRNPGDYVAALTAHACRLGAKLLQTSARGFRIENGTLKAVLTDQGELECDAAVIAAGAWSKSLARLTGDDVPLETERGYHVMLEGVEIGPSTPVMASDCKMVVTPLTSGLRAAGQVEIGGLHAAPNMARAEILKTHLLSMFPGLPKNLPAEKIQYWMGHRPATPDGMPCLGTSSATSDIVYAFGHGHVGLVGSAKSGRVVADLLSGRVCEIPIDAFDARRWSNSKPRRGRPTQPRQSAPL